MVSDAQVARVVSEISSGAEDPQHVAALVGAFMQRQPTVGHYVSSYSSDLSLEGVVLTLLHASALARCFELAKGRVLKVAKPADLDLAAKSANAAKLDGEPALESYLSSNVSKDDPTVGGKRHAIAMRLLRLLARAYAEL